LGDLGQVKRAKKKGIKKTGLEKCIREAGIPRKSTKTKQEAKANRFNYLFELFSI
jgi:hypothetical protein